MGSPWRAVCSDSIGKEDSGMSLERPESRFRNPGEATGL